MISKTRIATIGCLLYIVIEIELDVIGLAGGHCDVENCA